MESYIREIVRIQEGLDEAIIHLREQQSLVSEGFSPRHHHTLVRLLANGLRMYCWLEDRQRGLAEKIGELTPMRRR